MSKSHILHLVHYTDEHGQRQGRWCLTGRQALDLCDSVIDGSVTVQRVPRAGRDLVKWLNANWVVPQNFCLPEDV